ncbi:hypothetical protein J7W19_25785 [Streptomyces mobaraensis NBRC 13819 = DSM 40847]|uniref:Small hydrophobic protein n=2 Tax=Streptomyces mobaraensis TaxID=35621 RepID=A0A5N5W6J5_STRMB|nr:DUF6126 family protein [Streptomyces mobaraensis]EMF00774.1 hypothetical protein H340_09845 [Streptomyces mobaraensis NBRC 13819 = DSM 40847]KAB7843711.1 hypothetical protein FRZ00_17310 [Streptomyces mobaraensis]QTT78270.1 hypothetical protein J7W19_25785 [Streptomyces mobaraensis NBRC 13819 = DSM 40847]
MSDTAHRRPAGPAADEAATAPAPRAVSPDPAPLREAAQVEDRAPMGMAVRVFIYLVAVHFISAFFFLLFYLGK